MFCGDYNDLCQCLESFFDEHLSKIEFEQILGDKGELIGNKTVEGTDLKLKLEISKKGEGLSEDSFSEGLKFLQTYDKLEKTYEENKDFIFVTFHIGSGVNADDITEVYDNLYYIGFDYLCYKDDILDSCKKNIEEIIGGVITEEHENLFIEELLDEKVEPSEWLDDILKEFTKFYKNEYEEDADGLISEIAEETYMDSAKVIPDNNEFWKTAIDNFDFETAIKELKKRREKSEEAYAKLEESED